MTLKHWWQSVKELWEKPREPDKPPFIPPHSWPSDKPPPEWPKKGDRHQ